jgi:hypothetical protein
MPHEAFFEAVIRAASFFRFLCDIKVLKMANIGKDRGEKMRKNGEKGFFIFFVRFQQKAQGFFYLSDILPDI